MVIRLDPHNEGSNLAGSAPLLYFYSYLALSNLVVDCNNNNHINTIPQKDHADDVTTAAFIWTAPHYLWVYPS